MQELHEKLLQTMKAFHLFCEEQGLTYYMLGGTMLGAVRHQGFIPWDDDMDIGMPREDYEKLLAFAEDKEHNRVPCGYRIRNHRFESNVPYAFTHFEDINTTYIEQRRCKDTYLGGVSLEIFPLDDAEESGFKRRIKSYQVRFHKRILYGMILDYDQKKRVFPKSLIIKTIRLFGNMDVTTHKLDRCIRTNKRNCPKYSNLLGHWGLKEDISKDVFGTPVLYEFEGQRFYGAEHPHEYLTAIYGKTYLVPPSAEEIEKGKHPAAYMDLNTSYEKFKRPE